MGLKKGILELYLNV